MKYFTKSFTISVDKQVPKHIDLNACCYEEVGLKKNKSS